MFLGNIGLKICTIVISEQEISAHEDHFLTKENSYDSIIQFRWRCAISHKVLLLHDKAMKRKTIWHLVSFATLNSVSWASFSLHFPRCNAFREYTKCPHCPKACDISSIARRQWHGLWTPAPSTQRLIMINDLWN